MTIDKREKAPHFPLRCTICNVTHFIFLLMKLWLLEDYKWGRWDIWYDMWLALLDRRCCDRWLRPTDTPFRFWGSEERIQYIFHCCSKTWWVQSKKSFFTLDTWSDRLCISLSQKNVWCNVHKVWFLLRHYHKHKYRGILVYSIRLISISNSVSVGATNKSVLNIERS